MVTKKCLYRNSPKEKCTRFALVPSCFWQFTHLRYTDLRTTWGGILTDMKTFTRAPRSVAEARHTYSARKPSPPGHSRRYPIGAEFLPTGAVHFRLWAPKCRKVAGALD